MSIYEAQAICANGIGLVIIAALMLNVRGKYDKKKQEHFIFTLMLMINVVQCIIEPCTILIDQEQFRGAIQLATLLNALLYMNNIIFAMIWVAYADLRLRGRNHETNHKYHLIFIPGILIVIGAIVNLFTPVFFEITAENVYRRVEPFVYIPYVVTYFYLIWGTFAAYIIRRKKDQYVFLPAFTFLFPVCLASIIQLWLEGISLLWVGAAIGLMSAYMSLQDERAAVDPLSGVFTRHYMNQYLHAQCNKKTPTNQRISGIMLDIDKFKMINDQFGHLTGDEVIRKVGALLKRAVNGRGIIFRYAGDEFVVILINRSKEELSHLTATIQAEMEKVNQEGNSYTLACSLGYATYVPGEKARYFLKRMDDAMYANKNNKRRKESGETTMEDEELVYAGIDLPDLLSRLMQNKGLIRVFVSKFLEDKSYERLCDAVDKEDFQQMEFDSHILKGMCGNLSLKSLYQLFSEQVRLLRAGEGSQAVYMMTTIKTEYENAVEHMEKWLEEQAG